MLTSFSEKFYQAPECLCVGDNDAKATPAGDIYSFGIVLSEIITRLEAYEVYNMTPEGNAAPVCISRMYARC